MDPSHSSGERRTAARISFVGQAVVRAAGRHVPCTTVNLSSTGMLLLPAASARVGLSMRVIFEVKDFLGPLDLDAVLAREADYRGHYGWGVQFVEIQQRVDTLLQLYVRKRLLGAQPQDPTPPSGAEPLERADSGLYFQAKHRSSLHTPSSPQGHVLEATPDAGLPNEFEEARTERDPSGGFVALDASPWPVDLTVEPKPTNPLWPRPRDGHRKHASDSFRRLFAQRGARAGSSSGAGATPGRPGKSDPLASTARPAAPPLTGIGAPGGIPKRRRVDAAISRSQSASGARPVRLGDSTQEKRMSRTGPPRRGAVEAMHHTGPKQKAVKQSARDKKGDWGRDSHQTPLEIRNLYQAALAEVDGADKKKRKKKS